MKRFVILAMALTMLGALSTLPANATHEATPITITVTSTYAGLCNAKPSGTDTPAVPPAWTNALTANAALPDGQKIPADLWKDPVTDLPLGNVSGPCTYGTDNIWNVSRAVRASTEPNGGCDPAASPPRLAGCRGLHYPGVGPPVQPGRFLNYALNAASPDPKKVCLFVSTATPNQGTCTALALGYTFAVGAVGDDQIEGSYCGTSRGFGWTQAIPSSGPTTYSILEWTPSSAGSILPVTGVVTQANWATNVHYTGWEGTPGKPSMRFKAGTTKNVLLLTSARSYITVVPVDTEPGTPGSCSGNLDLGGVQFFNQAVAIAIGDAT